MICAARPRPRSNSNAVRFGSKGTYFPVLYRRQQPESSIGTLSRKSIGEEFKFLLSDKARNRRQISLQGWILSVRYLLAYCVPIDERDACFCHASDESSGFSDASAPRLHSARGAHIDCRAGQRHCCVQHAGWDHPRPVAAVSARQLVESRHFQAAGRSRVGQLHQLHRTRRNGCTPTSAATSHRAARRCTAFPTRSSTAR